MRVFQSLTAQGQGLPHGALRTFTAASPTPRAGRALQSVDVGKQRSDKAEVDGLDVEAGGVVLVETGVDSVMILLGHGNQGRVQARRPRCGQVSPVFFGRKKLWRPRRPPAWAATIMASSGRNPSSAAALR